MFEKNIVFSMFLIFSGAGLLATVMLYTRQSLLVAYMLIGLVIGPWGLGLVTNANLINQIGEIGIIFLLFLLGLHLQPKSLLKLLRKTTIIAGASSVIFILLGVGLCLSFGYNIYESILVGVAFAFSSTIIGLKLLPTTILHHQHTGEVMISILLFQDLIAIFVLVMLTGVISSGPSIHDVLKIFVGLPAIVLLAFCVERYVLTKLFRKFDKIHEYIFLLSIAWCLSLAELTAWLGLSIESGAFIAGVALAQGPIAQYIAESLKPLRDFFLVLFFFSVGATFNLNYLADIYVFAIILGVAMLLVKPPVFAILLKLMGEKKQVSWEVGVRLGQGSEFSLLVAYLAGAAHLPYVHESVSSLIQAGTIVTFMISSYLVVYLYPTPLAISDKMRRD